MHYFYDIDNFHVFIFEFFILYPCILLYAYHKEEPRVLWNYNYGFQCHYIY